MLSMAAIARKHQVWKVEGSGVKGLADTAETVWLQSVI